jgi:3-dehydroquinate dehydratase-2
MPATAAKTDKLAGNCPASPSKMARLLLLNGPNLSLLGTREPALYGRTTLAEIEALLQQRAAAEGHDLVTFQSEAEGDLIRRVHAARDEQVAFILFNPAAYTHTSVALRDALLAVHIPFIELHLSNVAAREDFRQRSYFSDIAVGTISGFGIASYELALDAAIKHLARGSK